MDRKLKNKIKVFFENINRKGESLLDIFFENKAFKYLSVYVVGMLMFYIASSSINRIISKYFVIEEKLVLQIPKFLLLSLFSLTAIYILYKLALKRYQLSLFMIHSLIVSGIIYMMLKWIINKDGWGFISFSHKLLFVDFLGILLLLSIILIVKNLLIKKETIIKQNPFVSDDPILLKKDDKLNYHKRASNIVEYLERSNFKSSFTIGIVGPWGNGKSSLISLIEEKLDEKSFNNTIHLKFLPYLNHNETDIISEFFKQLSTEINKYSGRLSNQFLSYSDKLLKLYKNKSITEFFKPNSSIFSDSSSYDSYKKINDTLNSLDKKFIVFVDDLDRLSNNEVLQVLKLVRNTANFKNFIFLIALDKDYVLESLIVKNDIADHTFVDKFFQLEVYLPEIDKSQLKTDFIDLLKQTDLSFEPDFIRKIEACIYREDNLFDDYISNYRGVKRLVNQLVFDFKSLPDDLDTNDLLNFTYLKMTFPYAIKFLNNNWAKIIPYNPETHLCELVETQNDSDNGNLFKSMRRSRVFYLNQKLNIDFSKYEISKDIDKETKINESNNLTKQQNILLVKTLIVLFGRENIADSHTSIKFENNLRKLLQQKIQEKDLSEIKFKSIFELNNDFENLKKLLNDGHINNILNRLAYFNTENKDEAVKAIVILLYIFNEAETYSSHTAIVWNILSDFINRQLNLKKGNEKLWTVKDKAGIWKDIIQKFIDKDTFKIERKIKFLALISESRIKIRFSDWGTTEDNLKEISLSLYKKLLENKQDNLWGIYDYSFYHAYHDVGKFHTTDVINPITIGFWSNNDITLLCAQMIENEAWTTKILKTSDHATQLFGSKQKFKNFLKDNLPNPITPELKEYIDFINLESLTNFNSYILYNFIEFDLVNQKLNKIIEANKIKEDEYDNVSEIVIEAESEYLGNLSQTNLHNIDTFINSRNFVYDNRHYVFINLKTSRLNQSISNLFLHYQNLLKVKGIDSEILNDNRELITQDGRIKIISVQPQL
ncbi:MAG: P-loop NTPase fold protein [Flavobacteriaceae bacterium]